MEVRQITTGSSALSEVGYKYSKIFKSSILHLSRTLDYISIEQLIQRHWRRHSNSTMS